MRSVEEALAGILAVARMTEAEVLPLEACFGRVPASFQLTAAVDVPPFDNSSMDGYALRAADTPGRLRLVGEVAAGRRHAARGRAGRGGTDHDRRSDAAGRGRGGADRGRGRRRRRDVEVPATELGAYVRRAGHDTRAGDAVTPAGRAAHAPPRWACWHRLAWASWRCVAARGSRSCRPATSCEPPGAPLAPGQIHDANGIAAGGGHHRGRRRAPGPGTRAGRSGADRAAGPAWRG